MKLLVIGGVHGNEPLGPAVVRLFRTRPAKNVDVVLANLPAIKKNCRFVKNDLNRSFPGDAKNKKYELRRAAQLLTLAKGYDLVLDFHNTHCPNNDCGFVGETAPRQLYNVSAWLGLNRIIVANYDCINKFVPNCLSVEISLSSQQMDASWWYTRISQLALLTKVPATNSIEKYRFVYRITLEDAKRLRLPEQPLKAFEPLNGRLAQHLGVASPAYPIFIGDRYTPYNYGGLLYRIPKAA